MTWSPSLASDQEVRTWMAKEGWPVTVTHYDFDREVYAWRHEGSGDHYTVRMSRIVLEDTQSHMLGATLDALNVAARMKAAPRAYTLVRRTPGGGTVVDQLPSPPLTP